MEAILQMNIIAMILIIMVVYLAPFIIVLTSSKTGFGEKIAWILAILFISWFAIIFYFLLAPSNKK